MSVIAEGIRADWTDDGELVLTVDVSGPGAMSASGKSRVFASTRGNVTVTRPDGAELKLGLNIYGRP